MTALVGRYVILERLGEGGMGVVYTAFDPELDRKVAIKLLHGDSGEQDALLREAQALARLAHPNVVEVHDVGSLDGRVFVAMELVPGASLRRWLDSERRSWREVVAIMAQAGSGLAAAHAAGLVHGDVKPENILVGDDGRTRVMDFGESGTPAYMAPEIFDGKPASAASDQFAFGVTLFEALFGRRPEAPPKVPSDTRVPPRIQRAVLRAIASDPAQRFASMDALLAELAYHPRSRRTWLVAGAAVLAVGGATTYLAVSRAHAGPCQAIEGRLAGVWDDAVKQRVRAGFLATKRPFATQSFTELEHALDVYATEWTTTAVESCRATRVRRDQTEDVMSLRQDCLEQRREELRSLAVALADPHPLLLDKADKIAGELEPVSTCSNIAMLRAPDQPPPALRAEVEVLRKELAAAKGQLIGGKFLPALVATQKIIDRSRAIGFLPVLAEASAIRGAALIVTGNAQEAAATFEQAAWLAIRARRDDVAASAALSNAMIAADSLGKPAEAKIWLAIGEQMTKRSGLERTYESREYMVAGMVAALAGDPLRAVAEHAKMFHASERVLGHDNPALWIDETTYATTLTRAMAYARAIPHFEHALALREKSVGPDHGDIAMILSNLGICYRNVGADKKARAAFERALALREKLFGKVNPILVPTLVNYAELLLENAHDPQAALPLAERAAALAKQMSGVEHQNYHETATTLAQVLARLGRVDEARKLTDDLLAIERRVGSVTLPVTLTKRAEIELDQKAYAAAADFAARAIASYEAQGGTETPDLWRPLTRLAQAKLALGDRAAAQPLLERAKHVLAEPPTPLR